MPDLSQYSLVNHILDGGVVRVYHDPCGGDCGVAENVEEAVRTAGNHDEECLSEDP
jgi:hypothetical protein